MNRIRVVTACAATIVTLSAVAGFTSASGGSSWPRCYSVDVHPVRLDR